MLVYLKPLILNLHPLTCLRAVTASVLAIPGVRAGIMEAWKRCRLSRNTTPNVVHFSAISGRYG